MFNDGAFAALTEKETKDANQIRLEAGQPIRFGAENERGVARGADGGLAIVDVADVGEDALIVHDPTRLDPGLAFSLARLAENPTGPTPIGIFRDVAAPRLRARRRRALGAGAPRSSWPTCCSAPTAGPSASGSKDATCKSAHGVGTCWARRVSTRHSCRNARGSRARVP